MNKHTEHDTREHLLATGEQLCLQRGFTGMGLSELLKTAEVPKGSFYHYFRSKEAFGVAMLERHYAAYHQRLTELLQSGESALRTMAGCESAGQNFAQFRATGKRAGPCKKHYCDACRLAGIFYHQTTGSLYVI